MGQKYLNKTAFVFSWAEGFLILDTEGFRLPAIASDCYRCVIKDWNNSNRKSESGKHKGKINLKLNLHLRFALHFFPVTVQFNCLVLNKSVQAKTPLTILSRDKFLSSADCTHNCKCLKCESEIKVVRMQNFSHFSWLCTEYKFVCLLEWWNKDCLNCIKTLGGVWSLDSWALFIVHPLLKYVLCLDMVYG